MNNTIGQDHFGRWLALWFTTTDDLYVAENAQRAKDAVRKMSTGQFLAIWHHRPKNK